MLFRPMLLAALAACPAFAQSGDAARFLPAKPMVVVELDGPAKLAESFADTNLAAMLKSQEMDALWDRAKAMVETDLEDMPPEARALVDDVGRWLESYAGRMTFGMQIIPQEDIEEEPDVLVTMSMSPDGESDLEELARRINDEVHDQEGVEIRVATLADGSDADVLAIEDDVGMLLPRLVDGHLVLAVGAIDGYLAELGEREAAAGEPSPDGFAMKLDHSLWALIPKLLAASDDMEAQMAARAFGPLLEMLEGMRHVSLGFRPAGEFTDMRMEIAYDPSRRSLSDLLSPPDARRVRLIDLAPRTGASISTMSLDIAELMDLIEGIVTSFGEEFSAAEEAFTEFTGVRLREDLLDRFDGTLLIVEEFGEEDLEEFAMTFAFGITDAAALEQAVETALRKRGLHAGRKTDDYRGVQVRKLSLGGLIDLAWAFTDDALMLGVGESAHGSIRKLIDASEDRKSGVEPAPWPKPVQERLAKVGSGWQWLSVSDMSQSTGVIRQALEMQMAMIASESGGEVPAGITSLIADFFEMMGEFELLTSVAVTTFERGRILMRQIL